MTKEHNNRTNELFQQALKALDDKIADPTCAENPLEYLNDLETLLIDEFIDKGEY